MAAPRRPLSLLRRPAGYAPDWGEADVLAAAEPTAKSVNAARAGLRADNHFLFELLEARPADTTGEPFDVSASADFVDESGGLDFVEAVRRASEA